MLQAEFAENYFRKLHEFVKTEYDHEIAYPPLKDIFRAFALTPFHEVEVVILGARPVPRPGEANGLCFAVGPGVPLPPSLRNIFEEIADGLGKPRVHRTGDLERWAKQGVLLLNATLIVRARSAGSHRGRGWERLTHAVIRAPSEQKEHLVFILWGASAKQKGGQIDRTKHLVIESAHPSRLSAAKGFLSSKPVSKANAYLAWHGKSVIDWL